jgi:NADH-quinone oxidoreductase subunit G
VKPLAETRPAWKVLRVLANLLDVQGFDFDSSEDVLKQVDGLSASVSSHLPTTLLSNTTTAGVDLTASTGEPVVASIYALDGTVRRAASLQLTADATRLNAMQELAA